ncbi:MAG TPA: DUF4012 domain-containing protein [Acidimicrobiales bacterium]|jgi:hypothetical protein|nr:DUF4012 domain-containing protein [Acidimicrobiales bacterium]
MPAYRHRQQRRLHSLRHGPLHFYRHRISGVAHTHQPPPPKGVRQHLRKRHIKVGVGVALGVLVLVVIGLGISAYQAISSARSSMVDAQAVITRDLTNPTVFTSIAGRDQLADDIDTVTLDTTTASATLHSSVGLRILGSVPYLNGQRNGIVNLVDDFGTVAKTGGTLLARVNTLTKESNGDTVALPALSDLQQSIAQAQETLLHLDRPVGDLIGPLAKVRREFDSKIVKINDDLARGSRTISYALPFLGAAGDRTYLIAGENNAEMRDQGMVLSVGLMHTHAGTFTVNDTTSVDTIEPTRYAAVTVPPTTQLVFAGFNETGVYQGVNATADFPFTAQDVQAMYSQVKGTRVDGVIALDVPAIEGLLTLTGPVTVPNVPGIVTATNVAQIFLHDQYDVYPAGSAQADRHDNVSAVIKAVVDHMKTEHVDLAALANALATDVAGRHLIVWDEVPTFESTIKALGASGLIDTQQPDRTFHVAVENSTATKLDYFVGVSMNAHVKVTASGQADITTTVTVHNDTPAGLGPTFQTGPDGINSHIPGQYVSRVLFWSPLGSTGTRSLEESGLRLSQNQVSVLPQMAQSVTFTTVIRHAVKDGQLQLRFIPQSRLVPATIRVEVSAPAWQIGGASNVAQPLAETTDLSWSLTK